ncbi:uncharacterized protein BDV14DRAFT_195453 [Aspergillus stella-maris]|uniref:uncharacterized protein n=1 Tax=Aspergillus stella-maris TaxID=1810926 RepID=UPI003CCCF815
MTLTQVASLGVTPTFDQPTATPDLANEYEDTQDDTFLPALFRPQSETTSYCGPTEKQYSPDRWIWGQFQLCIEQSATRSTAFIKVFRAEYYWGGAWYSANGKTYDWRARARVNNDEYTSPDEDGEVGGAMTESLGTFRNRLSGLQAIAFEYWQTGPYWGGETVHYQATYGFNIA